MASEHRHLFAFHRHGPYPRHKPNPGRWHAHVWWKHRHIKGDTDGT